MLRRALPPVAALSLALFIVPWPARASPPHALPLSVRRLDAEPPRTKPSPDELTALRASVEESPDDRSKRVALVRGLLAAQDLDGALAAAKAWRAKDAYNLVAVRTLGDVYMDRGETEAGERVYSAIVELLPRDPDAQRSLATLLKERGDLPAAEGRLSAAVAERPQDARLVFELADIDLRLGKNDDALARLRQVIDEGGGLNASEQVRYPARQRLGQLYGELLRKAKAGGDASRAKELAAALDALGLEGGIDNDIHVYLTWDTDRTDVDLWVTTPSGEKVFYQHRRGAGGESLFDDVTTGYGPESFTARRASPGDYTVEVNYYSGGRTAFPEARGEVVVVIDEGRATEEKVVMPYRLFAEKQTVRVAQIHVGGQR
jgi:tetratricopeptide (TPR) repeat protein